MKRKPQKHKDTFKQDMILTIGFLLLCVLITSALFLKSGGPPEVPDNRHSYVNKVKD